MTEGITDSRTKRRAQLVACAREVFAERGYHKASIDDVIRAAGVARGTFYNYFDSKRAVFQVVRCRTEVMMLPLLNETPVWCGLVGGDVFQDSNEHRAVPAAIRVRLTKLIPKLADTRSACWSSDMVDSNIRVRV